MIGTGFLLLGAVVILATLTAVLFIFPNLSIFGAKSVNERDTQIVYRDSILDEAFTNGRFIIESVGTQIEVKMSNAGYEGEGTIVVNEAATGIAFNSLNRTLVEWTQTMYKDELYYRLKVLEPSGIVFKDRPTTVYINLPHRGPSDSFKHDFVLQTGYSNVNFSFADNTAGQNDALKIGDLIVKSATSVNIPSSPNISINNIGLECNKTKFTCQSDVLGDVTVSGANGKQTFNNTIKGKLTITGTNNDFGGDVAGNVLYESTNGILNLNSTETLMVNTVSAGIKVKKVTAGVVMNTESGSLDINTIENNGLQFTAGTPELPKATANVSVGKVKGDVTVKNYGLGSVNLSGVNGNVDVESSQAGAGGIKVAFANDAENCKVKVLGYDGDIKVTNINGVTDIEVRDWKNGAGAANVYAHFKKVVGNSNEIKTGGYVSGHHDWGNVDVEIASGCNSFEMYIYGASSANSASKYGFEENNMYIIGENMAGLPNTITVGDSEVSGAVQVRTKQSVYLR